MALSDIAAGVEVTTEQCDPGIAAVDDTDADLTELLSEFEAELPCDAASAAAVLEAHTAGHSVGASAHEAGIAPMTAAKTLHLLGLEGVSPLTPQAHDIIADWLAADLSRSEAKTLTGANETEFALATFIETHDSLDGVNHVVSRVLSPGEDIAARRRARSETMSDVADLF